MMPTKWSQLYQMLQSNNDVAKRLDLIWKPILSLQIRHQCDHYIERENWVENAKSKEKAVKAFEGLLEQAKKELNNIEVLTKMTLQNDITKLEEKWKGTPQEFAAKVKSCLANEDLLIQSLLPDDDDRREVDESNLAEENQEVVKSISDWKNQFQVDQQGVQGLEKQQSNFIVFYQEISEKVADIQAKLQQMPNGMEKKSAEDEIQKLNSDRETQSLANYQKREAVVLSHKRLVDQLRIVLEMVWKEIRQWKKELKLSMSCMMKPKENIVDVLESIAQSAGRCLMNVMQQNDRIAKILGNLKYTTASGQAERDDEIKMQKGHLENMLQKHLNEIFVCEKVSQVVKVVNRKSSKELVICVRLLGGDALGIAHTLPTVKTWMYRDDHLKNPDPTNKICEIVNGVTMMEQHQASKQIMVNFSSVLLNNVKSRQEKVNDKLVMENMYGLHFTTDITVRDSRYVVQTRSLPIVIISHVMQECQAKGFLIWDAVFSQDDEDRDPFEHPDQVPWSRVADLLNGYYKGHTGRTLSDSQLNYLARILFKENKSMNFNQRMVTKAMLFKEVLYGKPGGRTSRGSGGMNESRNFQFWKWFYACINLVKELLKPEWDGLGKKDVHVIEGFISKSEAEANLLGQKNGTFLLRFSERNIEANAKTATCGCLTLAVVEMDPIKNEQKVYHVKEHLSAEDLRKRGLAPTLNAMEVEDYERPNQKKALCQYLWPNHPFNDIFSESLKEHQFEDEGYRKGIFKIEICLNDQRRRHDSIATNPLSPMSTMMSLCSPAPSDAMIDHDGENSQHSNIARVAPLNNSHKARRCDPEFSQQPQDQMNHHFQQQQQQQQQQQLFPGQQQQQMDYDDLSNSLTNIDLSQNTLLVTNIQSSQPQQYNFSTMNSNTSFTPSQPSATGMMSYSNDPPLSNPPQRANIQPFRNVGSQHGRPVATAGPMTVENMFNQEHNQIVATQQQHGPDIINPDDDLNNLQYTADERAFLQADLELDIHADGDIEFPLDLQ